MEKNIILYLILLHIPILVIILAERVINWERMNVLLFYQVTIFFYLLDYAYYHVRTYRHGQGLNLGTVVVHW